MQSDVTLVGGAKPPANLPPVPATAKLSAQAGDKPPAAAALGQFQPRPSNIGQSAAITEAKIALSVDGSPTAISQGERVLKPYGVTMLPDPQVANESPMTETEPDEAVDG